MVNDLKSIEEERLSLIEASERGKLAIMDLNREISSLIAEKEDEAYKVVNDIHESYRILTNRICKRPEDLFDEFKSHGFKSSLVKETVANIRKIFFDDSSEEFRKYFCYRLKFSTCFQFFDVTFEFVKEEDNAKNGSFAISIPFVVRNYIASDYGNYCYPSDSYDTNGRPAENPNKVIVSRSREIMEFYTTSTIPYAQNEGCVNILRHMLNWPFKTKTHFVEKIRESVVDFISGNFNTEEIPTTSRETYYYDYISDRRMDPEERKHYDIFERYLEYLYT